MHSAHTMLCLAGIQATLQFMSGFLKNNKNSLGEKKKRLGFYETDILDSNSGCTTDYFNDCKYCT